MADKLRIAVLISGNGTTMREIIRATKSEMLSNVKVALVVSSRSDAGGIDKAREEGILDEDIVVISPRNFPNSEDFGLALLHELSKRNIDLLSQNGWSVKTPDNVVKAYRGRAINQHPGPLDPGYLHFGGQDWFGRRVHSARLHFIRTVGRDFWTEATVHRVEKEYDKGSILGVSRIPILQSDDPITLSARLLPEEHKIVIQQISRFVNGTVKEWERKERLVLPGEEKILAEAIEVAKKQFPKG